MATDGPLGSLGPEIPAGTREYELVASVIRAVERRTGAPARWNGRLYEQPSDLAVAIVFADGTMAVHRKEIVEPLQRPHTAGRQLTTAENVAARRAIVTLAHEGKHLVDPLGDDSVPGAVMRSSAPGRALDEGLVDTWSQRNADAVIREVGFHRVAPGVLEVDFLPSYPSLMEATDGVLQGVSEATGLKAEEVRATVERTELPQRYNAMADLVLDHRLAELVPPEHRVQIQYRLAAPLTHHLGAMAHLVYSNRYDQPTLSGFANQKVGMAVGELNLQVDHVESHYRTWYERNPGTEPPRMQMTVGEHLRVLQESTRARSVASAQPRRAQDAAWSVAEAVAAAADVPAQQLDPDIEELRRFLGSHTSAGRPGVAAAPNDQVPDNVRHLDSRRGQGRGE